MKKLFTLFAAVAMAATVSAQTVTESKTSDNWYIGVNGGVATAAKGNAWLKNLQPNAGLRVGRYFTPVFGMALESNVYFKNTSGFTTGTVVNAINTSLLGTVNLSNWFGGYLGEPRTFEVVALGGLGWGRVFDTSSDPYDDCRDALTSKAGLDFAINLGKKKAWQVYIEPAMIWTLGGNNHFAGIQYDRNHAAFQLNAGVVYKFKNSNGTHNFTTATLRDQAEIDALNAKINELRNRKPEVKEVVKTVEKIVEKNVSVDNLVFVTFAQGKSVLTAEAKAALDEVAEGKHVEIVGTASPEGSKALNDKLSQARADVVAEYLKGRGVVVDSATGKGVQGTTSNRLAVVYVK